jgi:hypothetical protein
VVVLTARIYHREHAFSGNMRYDGDKLFEEYEQQLFTSVVTLAEKAGKHVSLIVVPTSNVFDGILQTAQRLESSKIVTGISNKLTLDEQGKFTGDSWERLPEPRPRLTLEIYTPEGGRHEFRLGPHMPRLRPEDTRLLHKIWLDVSARPELASIHHYHIVSMALERLDERLHGPDREKMLEMLKREVEKGDAPPGSDSN